MRSRRPSRRYPQLQPHPHPHPHPNLNRRHRHRLRQARRRRRRHQRPLRRRRPPRHLPPNPRSPTSRTLTWRDRRSTATSNRLVAQGFDRDRVSALLAAAEPQPKIIDAITRPAEKTLQWWEYRARVVTPARIDAGVQLWREHKELLDQIATRIPGVARISDCGARRRDPVRARDRPLPRDRCARDAGVRLPAAIELFPQGADRVPAARARGEVSIR